MMTEPGHTLLLSIVTVAYDLNDPGFQDTAQSLAPLLAQQDIVEWLVIPGQPVSGGIRQRCQAARLLTPNDQGI